jgi:acetylornithine/N-succinyldiaminopimelate aminotransferase
VTREPDANTSGLAKAGELLVPTYRPALTLVRGEGCTLWDAEGRSYLDFMGGIATTVLGHCHPRVQAALEQQSKSLWHVSNLFNTEPQLALAERLIEHSFAERVFFCNSGAEANEAALKIARRWHRQQREDRFEIVAFNAGFHGRTLFTLTATGQPAYREGFEPVVPGIHHAPYGDIEATKALVNDRTAAIILETIQGEGGVRPAPDGFVRALRELADERGCLLIFDEIQTGMGRTGPLFSYQGLDVVPDIMTLAKALGNGIPIGAMLTSDRIAEAFTPGTHGSTFGGNPLATACGVAVMDELVQGGVLEHAREVGEYMGSSLRDLAKRLGPERVVDVRGRGLLYGLELAEPSAAAIQACREQGVLVIPAGPNVMRMAPALIIERNQIGQGLEVIEEVLARP